MPTQPYFTSYELADGRWRASTDLGYFNGTSPSDVKDQYESAKIEASNARQDRFYRKHPSTEADS